VKKWPQKLRDWAGGHTSTEEIQSWACDAYMHDEVDFADWEKEDDSVTKEVVAALDMLDMNLVLPEDEPIYLEFWPLQSVILPPATP
jgi:hypothetical protein